MKMGENSKMTNYAMKNKMHLSLQLFGLVDKQKIEESWEFILDAKNITDG